MNATGDWGWRNEPSPLSACAEEDVWFFSDNEEKTTGVENTDLCQLTRSEIARQLLEDIENIVKKDNNDTFSDWLEQKVELPIFDEIRSVLSSEECKGNAGDDLDFAYGDDLTPPSSPEKAVSDSSLLLNLDDISPSRLSDERAIDFDVQSVRDFVIAPGNVVVAPEPSQAVPFAFQLQDSDAGFAAIKPAAAEINFLVSPPTPIADHTIEMAIVDEVIRNTAEAIAIESNLDWESETSTSRSSSSGSEANDAYSPRSSLADEESDDPEWVPLLKKAPGKPAKGCKRSKPYARECNQEDRRLRKKEQNKNAATRYRQKKKAEVSEILEEEKALEERKEALEQKVSDIRLEIKYLKGLMKDLFKAKGLLAN